MVYRLSLVLALCGGAPISRADVPAAGPPLAGQPLVFTALTPPPAPEDQDEEKDTSATEAMMKAFSALFGAKDQPTFGDQTPSPEPGADTDWDKYSYPQDHIFGYGGRGGGDIGNGMCTAKNANRVQVKNGYCAMLSAALNREGSCANREMKRILDAAGSSGAGIGDLRNFCSTYPQLQSNTQRTIVFQQILAGLITKESGWNPRAAEKPWTKNGAPMGGKGLFQIGVNDAGKDADCSGLNERSIMDAETNIKCGSCIALKHLANDRTIGHGSGDNGGSKGLAQYFGPFRNKQADKRAAIANSTNQYCVAATGGGSSSSMAAVTEKSAGRGTASN